MDYNVDDNTVGFNNSKNNLKKDLSLPKSFNEKARFFLIHIYQRGGKDHESLRFDTSNDYILCYSKSPEEFKRIILNLIENGLIKIMNSHGLLGGNMNYTIEMTDLGINEIEKDMPNIPMIGLVDQKISTGDIEIDEKINHAKDLFFQEPQTLDRMRSACESLCFVLEPLRSELSDFFTSSDVNDFFQIVNRFDIRHNKENTIKLVYEEQLEWVFYTLLNTVNTFVKIKRKIRL